ncbi:MAG TPA: PAS domain S-box protein [Gallionella sp.]|nr:PAS domain S-box protein [Gallionella sp.]
MEKFSWLSDHGRLALIDCLHDGIFVIDYVNFAYVNQPLAEMLGYPIEEMVGHPFINFVADEDKPLVLSRHKARLAGEEVPEQYEIKLSTAQGTTLYCALNVTLSKNSDGNIVSIGSVRDITQQKAIQVELEASQIELESIFNRLPDVFYRTDMQGITIKISPSVFDLLGYRPEEILGTPMASHYNNPEDRQKIVQAIIEGGGKATQVEAALKRKDGSVIWVSTSAYTRYEPDGTPFCVEGTARNITERKQMENKLRLERNHNQRYLDTTMALMVELDSDGKITMINRTAENLLGYAENELLGRNWFATCLPQPDGSDIVLPAFLRLMAGDMQSFEEFENAIQCRDGRQRIITWKNTLLTNTAGQIVGTLSSGLDITERKRAENSLTESLKKLEEKELSKTRFLAAAGHDLRQPLAAANMFLDALKQTEPTPEQDKIIQSLDRAMSIFKRMLGSLLDISKLDSGVIKPEYVPINVTKTLILLQQSLAPMAGEKKIGFKLNFSKKEALVVLGDIGLLNTVLMNLASNAIKFTSKGSVLISARKRGNEVLFQVWDTGIGIPGDCIEHIFDEFYQIGNQQRDRTAGLGLGLAIAKRAIALLDSEITCRSQIGQGTVFGFRLPLDDIIKGTIQQAAIEVTQEDAPNLSFVQGKRFVVVEDDLMIRQALTKSLEGLGGEVECFHSGEDALHHVNIGYADCYIVDYMLGGALNGIQFLNMLRKKLDKPINAVLVTGDTSSSFIRDASDCCWPALYKPVNTAELISTLAAQE